MCCFGKLRLVGGRADIVRGGHLYDGRVTAYCDTLIFNIGSLVKERYTEVQKSFDHFSHVESATTALQ